MGLSSVSVISSSVFYIVLGVWWHLQITKRYWACKQRKTDFKATLSYICCHRCRQFPMEGFMKLLAAATVCSLSVFQILTSSIKSDQNEGIGQLTVFILFVLSSCCDLVSQWCDRIIFPGVDYLFLVICFNVQSVVLSYHTSSAGTWMSVADTCAMYAATLAAVALMLEFKYPNVLWFALSRAFCTMVLGTWFAHIFVVRANLSVESSLSDDEMPALENNTLSMQTMSSNPDEMQMTPSQVNFTLVPMMFTWHCLFDMNFLTVVWVVTTKLAGRGCCVCMPDEESVTSFENRVHFDYHMITRMTDSDGEQ